VTLPFAVADIYLAMNGDWQLRPLAGITSSPLLEDDGTIRRPLSAGTNAGAPEDF